MAAKPPSPFASAKRVTTAAAAADQGSIYVADAVLDPKGVEVFSRDSVSSAIESYVQGARDLASADTLMKTNRPVVEKFALSRYTREWLARRTRPDNPKVTASPNGGATINYIVQDRAINFSDAEKDRLASIVRPDQVDTCVTSKEVFTLDPAVLDQTVTIKVKDAKGKVTEKTDTVMNHMAEALQDKFKDHADLLASLFTVKPVQQTAKGLIERGLELVTDPSRLAEFVQTIKAPIQLKPVGV